MGTDNGIKVYLELMKRLMHTRSEEKSITGMGEDEKRYPQIGWYHLALENIDALFKKTTNDEASTEESTEIEELADESMDMIIPFSEV